MKLKKLTHSSKKREEIYPPTFHKISKVHSDAKFFKGGVDISRKGGRIYLDYSASSPMDHRVLEAMKPYFSQDFGNAGSLHSFGQRAQAGVDKAREIIADSLGAKFNEIIFTGSASEANNLAIRGNIRKSGFKKPRLIVSAIEHESVIETAMDLESQGVDVVYLGVNNEGFIDPQEVADNLNEETVMVSLISASNVVGTVEPIKEIAEVVKRFRGNKNYPLLHTDAVQAFQYLDCNVNHLGVDMMTISGQKIYGPKGIGVLYIRDLEKSGYKKVRPVITGGAQEYGLRAGTENVPAIVGLGKAVELILKNKDKEAKRITSLRDYFWKKLKAGLPELQLNGSSLGVHRLPNNLNIYFPERGDLQELIIKMDLAGIAVSSGSACSTKSSKDSYVVAALGHKENRSRSSIRISLGRPVNKSQVDEALKKIIISFK